MRQLVAGIDCALVDIRGRTETRPDLYHRDDYSAGRAFGIGMRWPPSGEGENGIVYDSVRRAGGTNVCVYRPSRIILPVNQLDHYEYRWDASGAISILKLANVASGAPRH
jgi:hypothetical protein